VICLCKPRRDGIKLGDGVVEQMVDTSVREIKDTVVEVAPRTSCLQSGRHHVYRETDKVIRGTSDGWKRRQCRIL
jgi:hypothetical protein